MTENFADAYRRNAAHLAANAYDPRDGARCLRRRPVVAALDGKPRREVVERPSTR